MGYKWITTKTTGVRYREHPTRKNGAVKKDRYFTIRYKVNNILKEEGLGWASEGWTEEKAGIKRAELREAYRTGSGCITLKEKREKQTKEKELATLQAQNEKKLSITLDEFYNTYFLKIAQNNKAIHTLKSEHSYYKNWIYPSLGCKPMKDITLIELEQLKANFFEQQKSPKTINYIFAILSQILSSAIKLGYLQGSNPASQLTKIKFDNQRTRFLTVNEAHLLLNALKESSNQLYEISMLSLYCGLRAGEIFNLCWSDIDLDNKILTLRDTKNTKTRNIYMTENIYLMLCQKAEHIAESPYVFTTKDGNKINEVSNTFARVVDSLKLNEGITDNRQKVVFHTLRHTYASWLAQMGTDLYVVQKLMGHSSFAMTQRYAHLSPETLKKAVANFDERLKDE